MAIYANLFGRNFGNHGKISLFTKLLPGNVIYEVDYSLLQIQITTFISCRADLRLA
jgi:hypothetical protein